MSAKLHDLIFDAAAELVHALAPHTDVEVSGQRHMKGAEISSGQLGSNPAKQ